METEIIIVGHSLYPSGIKGVLGFIVGLEEDIYSYHIDNDCGINNLKNQLSKHFENKKTKIIFADIPGGSPHQKAVELALNYKDQNVIVYAGVGTSFIIDIAVKAMLIRPTSFEALKELCKTSWDILPSFSTQNTN